MGSFRDLARRSATAPAWSGAAPPRIAAALSIAGRTARARGERGARADVLGSIAVAQRHARRDQG
eukprot:13097811-Alexandrium_andersonii.AAC.1